ncbi:MAG: amidohydrolase [Caulobacterales bacterium]|nr:amidohydrolase [Caulobacterales bacterium]
MRTIDRRTFTGALGAFAAACAHDGPAPDLIIHGGPIYTGVEAAPRVEALRVRGGRFAALGALSDVNTGAGRARTINLNGAAAFAGFTDAHVHLGGVGMSTLVLDLVGVESLATMLERLRAYSAANSGDGFIYGRGWIETHWPERRFPTRADLDAIIPHRPVMLERVDGHAAVVNSAALALAGIDANTPNPAGGSIERASDGAATGMLIDNAMSLVQARVPPPDEATVRLALQRAVALYASRGWTGAANMSTSAVEARILAEMAASGALPLWLDAYLTPEDAMAELQSGPRAVGDLHVRGVKAYMDGALGSRGAALLAPYSDAHSDGLLVTQPSELAALLRWARGRGLQAATHAIGDRGNRLVLDAYRDVFADDPAALRAARWRVEHAQVIDRADIPRFAAMGVIASMQPSHAISDLHFAPSRLGPGRLGGAYAWRALLDSGAMIAAGSDAPVEKGDPLIEFYAACHRHDLSGFAGPDWHGEQAVSRAQALRMLTLGPAIASFSEAERGTIEVGKRADVSVFGADLMTIAPGQIPSAGAILTVSGGRITHEAL